MNPAAGLVCCTNGKQGRLFNAMEKERSIVHMDYETRSAVPLGGKNSVGVFRYVRDPSFKILMIGLAVGKERPVVWVPPEFGVIASEKDQARGWEILRMVSSNTVKPLVYAHNAMFEMAVTERAFEQTTGLPPPNRRQFRCTQVMARRAALPPALGDLAKVLRIPQQKDEAGSGLIDFFSTPQKRHARAVSPEEAERLKREFDMANLLAKRPKKWKEPRIYREWNNPTDSEESEAKFRQFIEYCRQDVVVERMVHEQLRYFEMEGDFLKTFFLDQDINARGMPVNIRALKNALKIVEEVEADIGKKFFNLTGYKHTQRERVLEWCQGKGWKGTDLQAATVDLALGEESDEDEDEEPKSKPANAAELSLEGLPPELREALSLRKKLSYASIKKIRRMLEMVGPDDNRIRGVLILHGAGPGRWSGFGVQPQNFKRPSLALVKGMAWQEQGFKNEGKALADFTAKAYRAILGGASAPEIEVCFGPPLEVISSCIRHFIHDYECCPECDGANDVNCWWCQGSEPVDRPMLSADFAAIEARLICWEAGQEDALQEYRDGIDRYRKMACVIYKVPRLDDVTEHPQRFVGKQAILLLGYQGGGKKFRQTCEKYGYYDLPKGLEFEVVKAFRSLHMEVKNFWSNTEKAARNAIMQPSVRFQVGGKANPNISFIVRNIAGIKFLLLRLPSGREIAYPFPKLEPCLSYEFKGERIQILHPTNEDIQRAERRVGKMERFDDGGYRIKDAITYWGREKGKSNWCRIITYGAKLVENITQGNAFDFMAYGAIKAEEAGYEIASLIHDEALNYKKPEQTADELCRLLTTLPPWAEGMPLLAEGKVVQFYSK